MTALYKYGRVAIAAIDFDTMKQFYSQILKQEPARQIKDVYVEFQLPDLRLGLFKPRPDNRPEFMHGTRSTASVVLEVTDIDEAARHFRAIGCIPPQPAFYHHPTSLDDIINQTVNRILDIFDISLEHDLFQRWQMDSGEQAFIFPRCNSDAAPRRKTDEERVSSRSGARR